MRLKIPKVASEPRMAEERSEDRCWKSCKHQAHPEHLDSGTNLIFQDPLDHDQTPRYNQSFHRVRKRMRLVSPGNVGGSHQDHSQSSMARRLNQLMNCPILENEA